MSFQFGARIFTFFFKAFYSIYSRTKAFTPSVLADDLISNKSLTNEAQFLEPGKFGRLAFINNQSRLSLFINFLLHWSILTKIHNKLETIEFSSIPSAQESLDFSVKHFWSLTFSCYYFSTNILRLLHSESYRWRKQMCAFFGFTAIVNELK